MDFLARSLQRLVEGRYYEELAETAADESRCSGSMKDEGVLMNGAALQTDLPLNPSR
jgi:hypothetical protein